MKILLNIVWHHFFSRSCRAQICTSLVLLLSPLGRHLGESGKEQRVKKKNTNWPKENSTRLQSLVLSWVGILKDSSSIIIVHNITTGVFWIGEFISTAIGIQYCDKYTGCSPAVCYSELVLDIPNLLAVKCQY